jgi:hypothetical protein
MATVTLYSTASQPILLCGGSAFVGQYQLIYPQIPLTVNTLFWLSVLTVNPGGVGNVSIVASSAGAV